jgi:hypothetical protein
MLFNSIFAQIVIEITKLGSENLFVGHWITILFLVGSNNFRKALCTSQGLISNSLRLRWRDSALLKDWSLIVNFLKYRRLQEFSACFGLCLGFLKFEHLSYVDWLRLVVVWISLGLCWSSLQSILSNASTLPIKGYGIEYFIIN